MNCDNCRTECDTLVVRAGVYVCAACVVIYDRLHIGPYANDSDTKLLADIRDLLHKLLYDPDVYVNVQVDNNVGTYSVD